MARLDLTPAAACSDSESGDGTWTPFIFLNTDFFTHGGWVGRRELGLKSAILDGRWEMKSSAFVKKWYTKMKFLGVGRSEIQDE